MSLLGCRGWAMSSNHRTWETMKPTPSCWGNKARSNNLGLLEVDKIMSGEACLEREKEKQVFMHENPECLGLPFHCNS